MFFFVCLLQICLYICITIKTNNKMRTDLFTTQRFKNFFYDEVENIESETQTKVIEIDTEYKGLGVYAEVECHYKQEDTSFEDVECYEVELEKIYINDFMIFDEDGEELDLDYELIKKELEK